MNNDSRGPARSPDDIDLLLFAGKCVSFFRRYAWHYAAALLLGIITGIYFYKKIPDTYKSRMILHSFMLTNAENIQQADNWNRLLGKKEYSALAAAFDCDEAMLPKVKSLKAAEIMQVFSPSNPNGFVIDAVVTDNNVLDSLQQAIVHGYENSPYVKTRLEVKRQGLREQIERTRSEIRKLDSNKKIMENILTGRDRVPVSLIVDGSGINRQLVELNEKLLNYEENLEFTNAVQVLQGFVPFRKPAGPHLVPWLIIGILGWTALAFATSFFHTLRRKMKEAGVN